MADNTDDSGRSEKLLPGFVVLPEVYDELERTGAPVKVICGVLERCKVHQVIEFLVECGVNVSEDEDDHTDYYVFATIKDSKQAAMIDEKSEKNKEQCIDHVWLNKKLEPCVKTSQKTINAPPARGLFSAHGEDVNWAVLDTGVDINHSWFRKNKNCSKSRRKDFTGETFKDIGTHGTHVAGIIVKIAPQIKLYDYKVLGKDGGTSEMIIKALYHIRQINFKARKPIIHGVNMSLGGPAPVRYGCGWSPECREADRLMDSGVVVCAAAGNDGYKAVATVPNGKLVIFRKYVDMSITDPGNADRIITVGSTHKTKPHAYGPSFFSSKGPTGDGRYKPDCLAPGEKIVSALARSVEDTTEMNGTSMATPHVSGAIAVFMSAKPEFMGRAREIKQILLDSCTDLGRDRYFQGAGMVDLLRMIQSV